MTISSQYSASCGRFCSFGAVNAPRELATGSSFLNQPMCHNEQDCWYYIIAERQIVLSINRSSILALVKITHNVPNAII